MARYFGSLAALAVTALGLMTATTSAADGSQEPAGSAKRDIWWRVDDSGQKQFGDCSLEVRTLAGSNASTWTPTKVQGRANCTKRHAKTEFSTKLKVNGDVIDTASGTFENSYGTGATWRSTDVFNISCGLNVQGVVGVTISGLGSTYVTTGSPQSPC